MSKRQKLSYVQLEDLPDEVILKICSFMDIREILKCAQVSKRIQAISKDESLWLKLNFFEGYVPYPFLEKAVENGCRYLSLAFADLYDYENSKIPLNLLYLEMSRGNGLGPGLRGPHRVILKNCHSLQKLALPNWMLNREDINHIGENGQTLKVLNLAEVRWSYDTSLMLKRCVELNELNFSNLGPYSSDILTALVDNLTPKHQITYQLQTMFRMKTVFGKLRQSNKNCSHPGLYSPDLSKCYFLQICTKIRSKEPIFYFNRPKSPLITFT